MRKPVETAILFVIICAGLYTMKIAGDDPQAEAELTGYGKTRLTVNCPDESGSASQNHMTSFNWPEAL